VNLTTRFDDALAWASELHRHQRRKGSGVPYVAHVMAVSSIVLEDGGDEDTAIAALLHDAIEDCGVTAEAIAARFGADVAAIVVACTDGSGHPKPPWKLRKDRAMAQLSDASLDVRALRVAAADKLHNVQSLLRDLENKGPSDWWPFTASPEQTLWYYAGMHAIIAARLMDSRLPDRLGHAVAELREKLAP